MEENKENTQEQSVNIAAIENVGNDVLANAISSKVKYDFAKHILIKPLEVEKVYKTLTVPEDSGEKDEEGEPIMQMTIKQVETESILRTGVIVSIPANLKSNDNKWAGMEFVIGDVIVFPKNRMIDFDLFKDTALVEPFDVIGKLN